MKLSKANRDRRLKGILIGIVVPVITLFIANYILLRMHPLTVSEQGFIVVQYDYWAYLMENLTDTGKYAAFFCMSANIAIIWFISGKKNDYLANGIVIPTVVYAMFLVFIRILG